MHAVRLLELFKESKYDPALVKQIGQGFHKGFRIPLQGDLGFRAVPCNHPSLLENISVALENISVATEMIHVEQNMGRIAGPFISVISPLGLIPKSEPGKFRVIHDLSFPKGDSVNSGIPKESCSVSYEDYDYLISLLTSVGQGCFITKADIKAAFRIIPVHPSDYHLLGFTFEGHYYYDKCLPMGCSISCKVFEQFSCALQWILQSIFHVKTMSHILDDFIFISSSKSLCNLYLQQFFSLVNSLSIPVKQSKTVMPSTCVIVHGIEVDTLQI